MFAVGDTLTLKVPGGTVEMGLGKERYIDLDGDSNPELRVVWNDVDRGSPQKRVNLGLYRVYRAGSGSNGGRGNGCFVCHPGRRRLGHAPGSLGHVQDARRGRRRPRRDCSRWTSRSRMTASSVTSLTPVTAKTGFSRKANSSPLTPRGSR